MVSGINDLHAAVTAAVSEEVGKNAAVMSVTGRWYASVAVVGGRVFSAVLELGDDLGFDTQVDTRTGMTVVRVFFTNDALPDTDAVLETVRNRAQLFAGQA